MKFYGIAEARAKLSECVETAQREPVVVMNHGKPAAVLLGVDGTNLDDIALMGDAKFWEMIQKRREPGRKKIALADLEQEVERRAKARGR